MCEIFQDTFTNAHTLWAFVEAISTFLAVCAAFYIAKVELPKLKRESTAKKVESVKYATDHLKGGSFSEQFGLIESQWKKGKEEYPSQIHGRVVGMFKRLDYIGFLMELGYVDKQLFFYSVADDLYNLERYITNFEHRKDSKIPDIKRDFPKGYKLLKMAAKAARK